MFATTFLALPQLVGGGRIAMTFIICHFERSRRRSREISTILGLPKKIAKQDFSGRGGALQFCSTARWAVSCNATAEPVARRGAADTTAAPPHAKGAFRKEKREKRACGDEGLGEGVSFLFTLPPSAFVMLMPLSPALRGTAFSPLPRAFARRRGIVTTFIICHFERSRRRSREISTILGLPKKIAKQDFSGRRSHRTQKELFVKKSVKKRACGDEGEGVPCILRAPQKKGPVLTGRPLSKGGQILLSSR